MIFNRRVLVFLFLVVFFGCSEKRVEKPARLDLNQGFSLEYLPEAGSWVHGMTIDDRGVLCAATSSGIVLYLEAGDSLWEKTSVQALSYAVACYRDKSWAMVNFSPDSSADSLSWIESSDGWVSFRKVSFPLGTEIAVNEGGVMYICGAQKHGGMLSVRPRPSGLFRSGDGGASWQLISDRKIDEVALGRGEEFLATLGDSVQSLTLSLNGGKDWYRRGQMSPTYWWSALQDMIYFRGYFVGINFRVIDVQSGDVFVGEEMFGDISFLTAMCSDGERLYVGTWKGEVVALTQ